MDTANSGVNLVWAIVCQLAIRIKKIRVHELAFTSPVCIGFFQHDDIYVRGIVNLTSCNRRGTDLPRPPPDTGSQLSAAADAVISGLEKKRCVHKTCGKTVSLCLSVVNLTIPGIHGKSKPERISLWPLMIRPWLPKLGAFVL